MPCVKPLLRTWLRKGNALLSIASDSACRVDPCDKPTRNLITCVRGGWRYNLQAQGDFSDTAPKAFRIKVPLESWNYQSHGVDPDGGLVLDQCNPPGSAVDAG